MTTAEDSPPTRSTLRRISMSAWEIADLSIRLAALKKSENPDLFGALHLMQQIDRALAGGSLADAMIETAKSLEEVEKVRESLLQITEKEPDEQEAWANIHRDSFGKKLAIQEPKSFPINIGEAVRIVSKERAVKRRNGYFEKFAAATEGEFHEEIPDRFTFWKFAEVFLEFCPRHSSPGAKRKKPRPQSGKNSRTK